VSSQIKSTLRTRNQLLIAWTGKNIIQGFLNTIPDLVLMEMKKEGDKEQSIMAGLDEDVLVLDIHDEDYQVTIS
jgi:hypothetical protein